MAKISLDRVPVTEHAGPIGNRAWTTPAGDFYWNGPGAGLNMMFGKNLTPVSHPAADGRYDSLKDVRAALAAFLAAAWPELPRT